MTDYSRYLGRSDYSSGRGRSKKDYGLSDFLGPSITSNYEADAEAYGVEDGDTPAWKSALFGGLKLLNAGGAAAYATVRPLVEAVGATPDDGRGWKETWNDAYHEGEGFTDMFYESWGIDEDSSMWARVPMSLIGFAADVALDPTTYVTGGFGTMGVTGIKVIGQQASKLLVKELGEEVVEKAARERIAREFFVDNADKLTSDELMDVVVKGTAAREAAGGAVEKTVYESWDQVRDEYAGRVVENILTTARTAGTGRTVATAMDDAVRRWGGTSEQTLKALNVLEGKMSQELLGGARFAGISIPGLSQGGRRALTAGDRLLPMNALANRANLTRLAVRQKFAQPMAALRGEWGNQYASLLKTIRKGADVDGNNIAKFISKNASEDMGRAFRVMDESLTVKRNYLTQVSSLLANPKTLLHEAGQKFSLEWTAADAIAVKTAAVRGEALPEKFAGSEVAEQLHQAMIAYRKPMRDLLEQSGFPADKIDELFEHRSITADALEWKRAQGENFQRSSSFKARTKFRNKTTAQQELEEIAGLVDAEEYLDDIAESASDDWMSVADINRQFRERYNLDFDFFEADPERALDAVYSRVSHTVSEHKSWEHKLKSGVAQLSPEQSRMLTSQARATANRMFEELVLTTSMSPEKALPLILKAAVSTASSPAVLNQATETTGKDFTASLLEQGLVTEQFVKSFGNDLDRIGALMSDDPDGMSKVLSGPKTKNDLSPSRKRAEGLLDSDKWEEAMALTDVPERVQAANELMADLVQRVFKEIDVEHYVDFGGKRVAVSGIGNDSKFIAELMKEMASELDEGTALARKLREATSPEDLREIREELDRFLDEISSEADTGFRGGHTAPQRWEGVKNSLDDVSDIYGDNLYDSRTRAADYHGDTTSLQQVRNARGNPDKTVKIYRAVPADQSDAGFLPGDWVTLSKDYAKEHGEDSLGGQYKILEMDAKAGDLHTDGNSLFEWGWNGTVEKDLSKVDSPFKEGFDRALRRDQRLHPRKSPASMGTDAVVERYQEYAERVSAALDKAEEVLAKREKVRGLADDRVRPIQFADSENVNLPVVMRDRERAIWYASEGVIDGFRNTYKASVNKERGEFTEYHDAMLTLFKTYATVGQGPSFHLRNFLGATVNNVAAGVRPKQVKEGMQLGKVGTDAVNRIRAEQKVYASVDEMKADLRKFVNEAYGEQGVKDFTAAYGNHGLQTPGDAVVDAYERGVFQSRAKDAVEDRMARAGAVDAEGNIDFQALILRDKEDAYLSDPTQKNLDALTEVRQNGASKGELARYKAQYSKAVNNRLIDWSANLGASVEHRVRMAAYLEGAVRFGGGESGSMFARTLHFDYGDLNDFERRVAKRILPFYTFTRYNLPLQARLFLNRPGGFGNLIEMQEALAAAMGDPGISQDAVPEWAQSKMGFFTPWANDNGRLMFRMETPRLDLFNWMTIDPTQPLSPLTDTIEGASPLLKYAADASAYFGGPTLGLSRAKAANHVSREDETNADKARQLVEGVFGLTGLRSQTQKVIDLGTAAVTGDADLKDLTRATSIAAIPLHYVKNESVDYTLRQLDAARRDKVKEIVAREMNIDPDDVDSRTLTEHSIRTGRATFKQATDDMRPEGMDDDEWRYEKQRLERLRSFGFIE